MSRFARLQIFLRAARNTVRKQRTGWVRCFFCCGLAGWLLPSGEYEPAAGLVLLGDVMLGRGVAEAHTDGEWGTVLRTLQPFTRGADIAAANLESPFACDASAVRSGPRSLVAPPDAVAALVQAGFDVLSTSNNHARDAGEGGIACTAGILAAHGIAAVGPLSERLETDVRGIRLVFLAFDFTGAVTAGAVDDLVRAVRRESGQGAIVVVSLHWGMEYQSGRDSYQHEIARRLADARATVLWGHHPHVVQETEWIGSTLVLYSLGNAVFDQQEPKVVRRGEMVWVGLDRSGVRFAVAFPFLIDPKRGTTLAPDLFSLRLTFRPS